MAAWRLLVLVAVLDCGSLLAEPAAVERAKQIDVRCIELEAAGESALVAGRFDRAIELFEDMIELRLESPYVDPTSPEVGPGEEELPRDMLSFLNNVEVMLYHKAVAWKALARWVSGDVQGAESELSWGPRDARLRSEMTPEQQQRRRRRVFSEQTAKVAGIWFERARWRLAADAYALARSERLAVTGNVCDDEVARQSFNQAMAEYKDGKNGIARALLDELRALRPDYRQTQVALALENIPDS